MHDMLFQICYSAQYSLIPLDSQRNIFLTFFLVFLAALLEQQLCKLKYVICSFLTSLNIIQIGISGTWISWILSLSCWRCDDNVSASYND